MNILSLNGAWLLDIPGLRRKNLAATVPGDMYYDLLNDGEIADPFWRTSSSATRCFCAARGWTRWRRST